MIVKNTSFSYYTLSPLSEINFPNKLIIGFSNNYDILLIDYYNGKIELNLTEIFANNGIIYDR
jgi:hypothetical protein